MYVDHFKIWKRKKEYFSQMVESFLDGETLAVKLQQLAGVTPGGETPLNLGSWEVPLVTNLGIPAPCGLPGQGSWWHCSCLPDAKTSTPTPLLFPNLKLTLCVYQRVLIKGIMSPSHLELWGLLVAMEMFRKMC